MQRPHDHNEQINDNSNLVTTTNTMQASVRNNIFEEVVSWTSARDSVASSALMRKLQQDLQYEDAPLKFATIESMLTSTGTEPGLTSQDNSWVGEGKCGENKIEAEIHGTIPVDNGSVHKTAKQLKNARHRQAKNERMKANNWQRKRKECSPHIPEEPTPVLSPVPTPVLSLEPASKKRKTAPETNTTDEEDQQDATVNDKSANQPDLYNLRRHSKQRIRKDGNKKLDTTDTAKFSGSSIVHVLIPSEVVKLEEKGLVFLHLNRPNRTKKGKVDLITWDMDSKSKVILPTLDLQVCNIAIVTTYENVKSDPMLAFVGSVPNRTPSEKDYILLGLFLQPANTKSSAKVKGKIPDEMDVQYLCGLCEETKFNINDGNNSNHHQSHGANFGFGARCDYHIKEINESSVGQFVFKKGKAAENKILENIVIEGMTEAQSIVSSFIGYNMHNLNATHLHAIATKAEIAGFYDNLNMKGKTGYASLFFNFDSSTMEAHMEFDMNMMTIYVPSQKCDKSKNHWIF